MRSIPLATGAPLLGSSTFAGETIASLGLTPRLKSRPRNLT
jgi:hypothetical protein